MINPLIKALAQSLFKARAALLAIKGRHCRHTPGKEENFEHGMPLVGFQKCLRLSDDPKEWCESCLAERALEETI